MLRVWNGAANSHKRVVALLSFGPASKTSISIVGAFFFFLCFFPTERTTQPARKGTSNKDTRPPPSLQRRGHFHAVRGATVCQPALLELRVGPLRPGHLPPPLPSPSPPSGGASHRRGAAPRGAVLLQQGHAAEGARADAALVLLHLGVGLKVGPQVGAVGEGPVAVGAGERALTCTEREETRHGSPDLTPSASASRAERVAPRTARKRVVGRSELA